MATRRSIGRILLPALCLLVGFGGVRGRASDGASDVLAYPRPGPEVEVLLSWLDGRGDEDPHRAWEMQDFATERLLALGEAAVGPLVHRMASGDLLVRIQCIRLLARLGRVELGAAFLRHLAMASHPHERLALVQSLGQLGHRPAREALRRFLVEARDPTTRAVAIQALGRVGEPADGALIAPFLEDDGLVLAALEALERIADPSAWTVARGVAMSDRPLRVRAAALASFARLGGRRALADLTRLWTEAGVPSDVLLDALGSTRSVEALPYLIAALRGQLPPARVALGEAGEDVILAAAVALGRSGRSEAVPVLRSWLLRRRDGSGRILGLASLYRLTGEDACLDSLDRLALGELDEDAHRKLLVAYAGLSEAMAAARARAGREGCAVCAAGRCSHDHGAHGWLDAALAAAVARREATR